MPSFPEKCGVSKEFKEFLVKSLTVNPKQRPGPVELLVIL